jgi:methylmalonyl-CoA mutase N-terminal domain/subunit
MNTVPNKTVEQIISVAVAVVLVSCFSSYVQISSADVVTNKVTKAQLAEEIALHEEKIKELQLKKFAEQRTPLTDEELAQMLYAVGFEGKALRVAWAVVKKESNGRPLAFNGNTRTGDSSYGIFQINMIGGLGVARREKYDLKTNRELFDPVVNAEIALHMTNEGEDWSSWKVGSGYNGTDQARFLDWYKKFPEGVTLS